MRLRSLTVVSIFAVLVGCGSATTKSGDDKMIFPDNASAARALSMYIELGQGYLQQKDILNARRSYTKALRIDGDSPQATVGMALIYQVEGEVELADKFFKKALKQQPNSAATRNNYGSFLYSAKRYDDALEQLTIASQDTEYNRRSTVFNSLGAVNLKLNDLAAAEQAFQRALRLDPRSSTALINLSRFYFDRGDFPSAKRMFDAYQQVSAHSAMSLWLGVKIESEYQNIDEVRRLGGLLGSNFPYSKEFLEYRRLGVN